MLGVNFGDALLFQNADIHNQQSETLVAKRRPAQDKPLMSLVK